MRRDSTDQLRCDYDSLGLSAGKLARAFAGGETRRRRLCARRLLHPFFFVAYAPLGKIKASGVEEAAPVAIAASKTLV